MKQEIQISGAELRQILMDYEFNDDIMCEDDDKVRQAKQALSIIPEADRILFCLYMELGASRKVGQILGVSHSTILKEINRIRQEIKHLIMKL